MRTRKFPTILVALVATLTLIAACSDNDDNGDDQESTPRVSESSSTTEELRDSSTTSTTEAEPECEICDRSEEMAALPDAECVSVDAYAYFNFDPNEHPEVRLSGAHFYYDCDTDSWGWYFEGGNDASWPMPNLYPGVVHVPAGCEYFCDTRLPIDYSGAPTDLRHPNYPEALTLAELMPGMTVCLRDEWGGLATITVEAVFTYVSADEDGWVRRTYPAYTAVEDDIADEHYLPNKLEEDGVIPTNFGLWAGAHMTAGSC